MPCVRGCNLPDDLLYDVENHMWYRVQGDGTVRLGMTAVATAMAGKSCGTPESGKWVGPAKSVASSEVGAVNDPMVSNPGLANDDPYEAGWLIVLKPEDWGPAAAQLVAGKDVAAPYEATMNADGFAGCQS